MTEIYYLENEYWYFIYILCFSFIIENIFLEEYSGQV